MGGGSGSASGSPTRRGAAPERPRGDLRGVGIPAGPDPAHPHGRAATAPAFEAYRPFSEGLEQYLVRDYRQAIAFFQVARDADSTFVAATIYEALSHSNLGEFAAEDSLLSSLVRADARLTPFERRWLEYRRALLAGNRPAALLAMRSAAAEAPGSKAVYNLGVEAMEGRRLADAGRPSRAFRWTAVPCGGS